jgi:hypothetical protein
VECPYWLSCTSGSNTELKELRLPSCKLKAYSVDLVAQQIERGVWPILRLLDLSYNVIEFATIQILAEGSICPALRVNLIDAVNASFLFAALSCQPLDTLLLSCCGIKPNGAQLLAQ